MLLSLVLVKCALHTVQPSLNFSFPTIVNARLLFFFCIGRLQYRFNPACFPLMGEVIRFIEELHMQDLAISNLIARRFSYIYVHLGVTLIFRHHLSRSLMLQVRIKIPHLTLLDRRHVRTPVVLSSRHAGFRGTLLCRYPVSRQC